MKIGFNFPGILRHKSLPTPTPRFILISCLLSAHTNIEKNRYTESYRYLMLKEKIRAFHFMDIYKGEYGNKI